MFRSGEEYTGLYLSHGNSKTVFILKGSDSRAMFHDKVLKTTRGFDVEPLVFRQMQGSTPKLLYECYGDDGHNKYHCWVAERCIPLNQLVNVHGINKENCILAACRCLARAALGQASGFSLLLSDCRFYNLAARIIHLLNTKW